MAFITQEMWEKIAKHLGPDAYTDTAGSIVITGGDNVLVISRMADDCVNILALVDSLVSSPSISVPLIDEVEYGRNWVILVSTYRKTHRTRAQIWTDGSFQISGPNWAQKPWLCSSCNRVGTIRYNRKTQVEVISGWADIMRNDHHLKSPTCLGSPTWVKE